MRLLVDECLREELTTLAERRGHLWTEKQGWKDWQLKS